MQEHIGLMGRCIVEEASSSVRPLPSSLNLCYPDYDGYYWTLRCGGIIRRIMLVEASNGDRDLNRLSLFSDECQSASFCPSMKPDSDGHSTTYVRYSGNADEVW